MIFDKKQPAKFDVDTKIHTVEYAFSFYEKEWKILKRRYHKLKRIWIYTIDDEFWGVHKARTIKDIKESELFASREDAEAEALRRNRG